MDGETILHFAGWKHHFFLYPVKRNLAAAFKSELAGFELEKGTLRIPLTETIPVDLIKRIAEFRAKEVRRDKPSKFKLGHHPKARRNPLSWDSDSFSQSGCAMANKLTPREKMRAIALAYPEAIETFPWGECAIKVRGKTFVFIGDRPSGWGMSVKLPHSREFALAYPFTEPTHYGLGKSGWVSASFKPREKPPIDVLEAWIRESYCAIAPKSLSKKLG